MNSVKILLADLKDSKLLMFFIIFIGALSSAFKALTITLVKVLGDLFFEDNKVQVGLEAESADHVKSFLDTLAVFFQIESVYIAIGLLGIFYILANVMRYVFSINIRNLTVSKSVSMRELLMSHYLKLDARVKSEMNDGSGGLISRLLNDVQVYQQGLNRLTDLIKEPFLVVFAAVSLCLLNWKVFLFLFVGLPPILLIIMRISKSLRKHSRKSQETMESLTMTLKEGLDGARIVHSFDLQEKMETRFKKQTRSYFSTIKKIISREELSGPLTESISSVVFCVVLVLMYLMAKKGSLSSGDFFAIIAAIGFLSDSARKTQRSFIRIQQAATAKVRINSLLLHADKKASEDILKVNEFPKDFDKIRIENLSVDIGEKSILKNISLDIAAGKTIALVGSSGSGKSTLLNVLDLYIKPSNGRVLFNNVDSQSLKSDSLKSSIALVSQDPFLFNLSVFENLRLVNSNLTEKEAVEALKLANADFVLSRPESIHSMAGERGSNFSGGERQRISIARALIKDAPILLLDEATSALDTQSEKEVQKGLDSLKKGRTCFVVAHRISTILDSDNILVFNAGEIIQSGTHQELLEQSGLYSDLCQMQRLI